MVKTEEDWDTWGVSSPPELYEDCFGDHLVDENIARRRHHQTKAW